VNLSEFSDKHIAFREEVRTFAKEELLNESTEIDRKGEFPWHIINKIKERGWLGVPFPEKYGGLGLDTTSYIILVEEIARVCASTAIMIAAHVSLACQPIYAHGTEDQKKEYLVPLARGEKIGSFGLTEPNAGSDAGGTETSVRVEDGMWVINGNKRFITNGHVADIIVFTASQDREKKTHGISAFIVEKGTKGFEPGKKEDKMGLRGSITSELHFEDCMLPKENLLGEELEGFKVFMETLDGGRISIGVLALGIAQGALDYGISYVQSHSLNGKPLKKYQWIQKTIADAATEIAASRHLIYHAAMLKDQGKERITKEGAMAKLFASEVSTRVCSKIQSILGDEGLNRSYPIERFLRDTKLMEIGEGTSEVQRIVISRQVIGR
jgi:butyryl-CoA dehydrogenase